MRLKELPEADGTHRFDTVKSHIDRRHTGLGACRHLQVRRIIVATNRAIMNSLQTGCQAFAQTGPEGQAVPGQGPEDKNMSHFPIGTCRLKRQISKKING